MLEGTKHEKAVLVVLAYIIGLTSGFIGFGINNLFYDSIAYSGQYDDGLYNVEYSTSNHKNYDQAGMWAQKPVSSLSAVEYQDGELVVFTDENELLLSVHIDKLGDVVPDVLANQGHHVQPPVYLPSPDGQYVYFCEQHLGTSDCTNLLFDTETEVIQYVHVGDQKLITPINMAASAYWSLDGLHIDEFVSATPILPWKLVSKAN